MWCEVYMLLLLWVCSSCLCMLCVVNVVYICVVQISVCCVCVCMCLCMWGSHIYMHVCGYVCCMCAVYGYKVLCYVCEYQGSWYFSLSPQGCKARLPQAFLAAMVIGPPLLQGNTRPTPGEYPTAHSWEHSPSPRQETRRPDFPRFLEKRRVSFQCQAGPWGLSSPLGVPLSRAGPCRTPWLGHGPSLAQQPSYLSATCFQGLSAQPL